MSASADEILAQLEVDHAAVSLHATLLTIWLDAVAGTIVTLEPTLGPAETWIAGIVGGLVLASGVAAPLSGLATALTLLCEKGVVGGLASWAKKRLAAA